MEHYDVVVAGTGAMGSASLFHLARRGQRVLGLDARRPPHQDGSHHGRTRIIREAYYEGAEYVPLVQRSYELWAELEAATGARLYQQTGGLSMGREETDTFAGARASAREHALAHEDLSAQEIMQRFPAWHLDADLRGVFEARAGALNPEKCVAAHLSEAQRLGAQVGFDEPLLDWRVDGDGVVARTPRRTVRAKRLVLSVGAGLHGMLKPDALPIEVERQVAYWFRPKDPALFHPGRFPVFLLEMDDGVQIYGFPDFGDGFKIGIHHHGETVDPSAVDRTVRPDEEARMRRLVRRFLPMGDGELLESSVCLYTNTPDYRFVFGPHPDAPPVLFVSPCSGHGFKFSSAIGEAVADLTQGRPTRVDLSGFDPATHMRA